MKTPDDRRLAGTAIGEVARRLLLPGFMLASDFGDLDSIVMLGERTERSARFDRLQLLRIANQHDLRTGLLSVCSRQDVYRCSFRFLFASGEAEVNAVNGFQTSNLRPD